MRVVVVSQPSERTVSNSQFASRAITRPYTAPPMNESANSPAARPIANSPVMAAAMANWKPTMPDASLNNDSPLSTPNWRRLSDASLPSELTATASVGPSAAPSASAAASVTDGQTAWTTTPTATMVAMASPIANDNDSFSDFSNSDLSISCASRYSSGAMNSTMNSSGFREALGNPGTCVMIAPIAI